MAEWTIQSNFKLPKSQKPKGNLLKFFQAGTEPRAYHLILKLSLFEKEYYLIKQIKNGSSDSEGTHLCPHESDGVRTRLAHEHPESHVLTRTRVASDVPGA